jgi:hypothetical protein
MLRQTVQNSASSYERLFSEVTRRRNLDAPDKKNRPEMGGLVFSAVVASGLTPCTNDLTAILYGVRM